MDRVDHGGIGRRHRERIGNLRPRECQEQKTTDDDEGDVHEHALNKICRQYGNQPAPER